jgi:hypothetical protein
LVKILEQSYLLVQSYNCLHKLQEKWFSELSLHFKRISFEEFIAVSATYVLLWYCHFPTMIQA